MQQRARTVVTAVATTATMTAESVKKATLTPVRGVTTVKKPQKGESNTWAGWMVLTNAANAV